MPAHGNLVHKKRRFADMSPSYIQRASMSPNRAGLCCRPAVILSYIIGGIVALITACNYAEMGADYPLAGAAFNYVLAGQSSLSRCLALKVIIISGTFLLHARQGLPSERSRQDETESSLQHVRGNGLMHCWLLICSSPGQVLRSCLINILSMLFALLQYGESFQHGRCCCSCLCRPACLCCTLVKGMTWSADLDLDPNTNSAKSLAAAPAPSAQHLSSLLSKQSLTAGSRLWP